MIKLAIFDWNGTLLADTAAILEASNKVQEVYGRPSLTIRQYRAAYDMPIARFHRNLGISDQEILAKGLEVSQAFHAFYEPRVARAHTRTGARALLEDLGRQHVSRIILSNHTSEGIYLQLARLKLEHHFEAVLANSSLDGALHEGKQNRLHEYLRRSDIKASESVIIGDTVEEVHIGRSLGIKTVCVTGGAMSPRRLREAKPDAIIHKLHDLIPTLEKF